ncbi:MAG: RraA family protein [bacterium]|nr:RraA family protein [bacterium]
MQVASASVSDAVDQVIGRRGFMSHDIRPLFPTKMCGRAVTVLARPANRKEPPSMALELIDTEPPGRVLVIVMDGPDGADVAAFGGIMCTGSMENGFAGAVLDGGCRDRLEIIGKGFPVYARGVVPSNSVGRYVNVAKNEPVQCGGVTVNPGDMIVGDADGVVVVPQARAWDVLNKAIELEKKEAITTEAVKKYKSIRKAAEVNNRI